MKNVLLCLSVIALYLLPIQLKAQRADQIKCTVNVETSQITDAAAIERLSTFKDNVTEYISAYEWDDQISFEEYEVIEMNMNFTIMSSENSTYTATVLISFNRPIYNTLQKTTSFRFLDDSFSFYYDNSTALNHNPNVYNDIASFLDFYSFMCLAMDADTFAPLGGQNYLLTAMRIADIASNTGGAGWSSISRNNRRAFAALYSNSNADLFRQAIYKYYREGIDLFTLDEEEARTNILAALKQIQESKRLNADTFLFDNFFSNKYVEITSIFTDAKPDVRLEAYALLSEIDPSHISEYDKLQ